MRLTLRTLLAFRDGVLSPQDHEDLNRRIQENTPVANLLSQINDLVRSSEIRSPRLDLIGPGDANSVAEYLDDELSSELVAELERRCLQNADHLCELAHCHQLLAEALHSHVSVSDSLQGLALSLSDPKQRETIRRRLLTRSKNKAGQGRGPIESSNQPALLSGESQLTSDSLEQPQASASVKSPLIETGTASIRQAGLDLESSPLASEVPAYLLASQRKRWQIPAAILALTAMLAVLVWQSLGSLDSIRSLWQVASSETNQPELPEQFPRQVPAQQPVSDSQETSENATADLKSPATPSKENESVQQSSTPSLPSDAVSAGTETAKAESPKTESAQVEPAGSEVPLGTKADLQSDIPQPEVKGNDSSNSIDKGLTSDATQEPQLGLTFSSPDSEQNSAVVFIAEKGGTLQLLSERPPLASGRVVVPPSVRASLQMGSWNWSTCGATTAEIEFKKLPAESGQAVELTSQLFRGIFTSSDPNQELTLRTPVGSYQLRILAPSVWLAVEITSRPMVRGSLSQAGTYAPALIIVASMDGSEVPQELAQVVSVEHDQRFVFRNAAQGVAAVGDLAPTEFSLQNPPRWYSKRSIRLIDQEASRDLFEALYSRQNSIGDEIGQLTKHDRPELAALAIQSSLLLGNWRPLVSELIVADRLRAHWTSTLELARQLAVGNQPAQTTLQELFREDFGADAPRLFELFEGLSQPRQDVAGLTELLKGLESESLPIRVLSSFELTQLTGTDHGFLPHAPVKSTIQQLRRALNTGKLTVAPAPDPIWERTPKL